MADHNEILLYDQFASDNSDYGISAEWFAQEMRALNHHRSITIRINSPGGGVFCGMAIFESIVAARRAGQVVNVSIDGAALSAASVVAMAGETVTMSSAAVLMIHECHIGNASGNAEDLEKTIASMRSINARLVDIYAARTKQPKSKIRDWMKAETWFGPRESVELGFADRISTVPGRMAAQCSLALGEYQVPERIRAEIRQPIETEIRRLVRECSAVRTADSYEAAISAKARAADIGAEITRIPGVSTQDLKLIQHALERADPWANESEW